MSGRKLRSGTTYKGKSKNTKAKPVPKKVTKKVPARSNSSSTEEEDLKGPAAELLVPEPPPASAADSLGSLGSGSRRSRNPKRSNKAGIDEAVQKQILESLEGELGKGLLTVANKKRGIGDFLEVLAKDHEDIFGNSWKDNARKAADNKIRYWANLPPLEYEQVLEHFKIPPYKFRSAQKEPPSLVTFKQSYREHNTSVLSSSEDESTKTSTTKSSTTKTSKSQRSKPFVPTTANTSSATTNMSRFQVIGGVLHGKKAAVSMGPLLF